MHKHPFFNHCFLTEKILKHLFKYFYVTSFSIILCYNEHEIFSLHVKYLKLLHMTFYKKLLILAESNKYIFSFLNLRARFCSFAVLQLCFKIFQQELGKKTNSALCNAS